MSNRSSIFSFDMFPEKIYPTKAFLFAFLLVSVTFIGMFGLLHSDMGKRALEPRLGNLMSCLEYNLQHADKPLILFIGSSRFHAGISEETLNKTDSNYRFLNLSADSLQIWEQKLLIDMIPANSAKVAGVVLECHFSQFNDNAVNPKTKQKSLFSNGYDVYGGFSERLRFANPEARKTLLLHWFYIRRPVENYLASAKRFLFKKDILQIPPPSHRFNEEYALKLKNDPDFKASNIAKCHLNHYSVSEQKKEKFEKIVLELKSKRIPFVCVHVPVRQEYIDYFKTASAKENEQFNECASYFRSIGQKYSLILWMTPEDLGLADEIFLDYGHYSKNGSVLFSTCLWNKIQSDHLLKLQSSTGESQ